MQNVKATMALTTYDKHRLDKHPGIINRSGLRIYIAGPYGNNDDIKKLRNVARARVAGAELYRRGHIPFIPHTMTQDFELQFPDIAYDVYIDTDIVWLGLCTGILMLKGWEKSNGSRIELTWAREHGKIVFWDVEDVPNLTNYQERDGSEHLQI